MVKMLVLEPIFNTYIPDTLEASAPFSVHVMFNGSSPFVTAQFCWTSSPAFTAFLPNVKGEMEGVTTTKKNKTNCTLWKINAEPQQVYNLSEDDAPCKIRGFYSSFVVIQVIWHVTLCRCISISPYFEGM